MNKLTTTAAALALMLAGGAALADDNSMSPLTGDSYKAFEASRLSAQAAPRADRHFTALPDNSMSRLNGDSYAAFENARKASSAGTPSIAEANKARAAAIHEKPAYTARRGKTIMSPFRDDAA
jgi:hypothetical protein